MTYEYDPKYEKDRERMLGNVPGDDAADSRYQIEHRPPPLPGDRSLDGDPSRIPGRDPHGRMKRGRWKNACEKLPPGTLCYGFIFEEDPDGPHEGIPSAPPEPGRLNIQVEMTDETDVQLPYKLQIANEGNLRRLLKEFRWNESRAGGDPWIGPSHEWKRRAEMVEAEMRRRGLQV